MSSAKPKPITISPELDAEMTPAVRAFVKSLLKRIEELEAKVGVNPQNSSLPPSTQHPHAKPAPRKPKSKRKRGGQPGHKKHERTLIPSDQCNDVQPLKPTECRRCGKKLAGSDAEPLRHQVWELPEITPLVTEFQLHRLECDCCGETTCAELPIGVPRGQSGPRLMAFTALLMAYYRQSKRRTAEFLTTLLGQPCCAALTPVRREVEHLLQRGVQSGNASLVGMCRELYEHRGWLWTFVRQKGVEPTNNAGERVLRHAVIWRKLSFGTQSAAGSRFVETMLTVIETCRQQRRSAFDYLTAAIQSHLARQTTPSLLPKATGWPRGIAPPGLPPIRTCSH